MVAAEDRAQDQTVIAKLRAGRPVVLDPAESCQVIEALRSAIAIVLECPAEHVTDESKLFDELALDSIDVFDVLDQLADRFEAQVALEDLPADLIRGKEGLTFKDFSDGILAYFATTPKSTVPGAGGGGAGARGPVSG